MRRGDNAGIAERDGQRRIGCLGGVTQEMGVVVRKQNPNEEHGADIEDQNPPEYLANSSWDGFLWI